MYKIRFLSEARRDLEDIYSYISNDSIEYAVKVVIEVHKTISYLKDFPYMGGVYEGKLRRIISSKYKYIVIYVFEEDCVYIKSIIRHQNY